MEENANQFSKKLSKKNSNEAASKTKIFKIISSTALATFIGVGTMFGLVPISVCTNMPHSQTAAATVTALPPEEKLAAGIGLGLNPDTDPTIFTTESGIEIKFGGANLTSGALSGYTYITVAGTNWVIIGKSTSGFSSTTIKSLAWHLTGLAGSSAVNAYYETTTAAGIAIYNDKTLADHIAGGSSITLSSKEINNGEIPSGCVLCLSEKNLGNCAFDADGTTTYPDYGRTANYASNDCDLNTYITNYYNNNFPSNIKRMIPAQTIKTAYREYNNSTQQTSSISAHLFPLAHANNQKSGVFYTQNYKIETYLNSSAAICVSYTAGTTTPFAYWLRSGSPFYAYYGTAIYASGVLNTDYESTNQSFGVRPAFVLKIS